MANEIVEKMENEKISDESANKSVNKCPEYILRNQRKYYAKKKQDAEYMEKRRQKNREYRDANREHVNELARLRKRERTARAKQELEKAANSGNQIDTVVKEVENLTITE